MNIGTLARGAGCTVETVRYYEHAGLLAAASRNGTNNYRQYGPAHLEQLTFIRRCRALDMTHNEIRALLEARAEPDVSCARINAVIENHLGHVQARLAELHALEAQLTTLRSSCQQSRPTRECGILRGLDQQSGLPPALPSGPATHPFSEQPS